ncbi:MAG: RsmB/NOP family class I SAM-dependent RNA methyltransferase [Proteobacteria bacterium]|nr:RsmB/NOP family class I SAM-dependent RNA methyltransferase [Pseudomonadota bacterium]
MHPRTLLNACTDLLRLCLAFEHPADAVVSRYFREQRGLGGRERRALADAVYAVLRRKLLYEHFAAMVPVERPDRHLRRLAVLGLARAFEPTASEPAGHALPRDSLDAALDAEEQRWLVECEAVDPAALPAPCRHNLPQWLAERLRTQLGEASDENSDENPGDPFWSLAESLLRSAPLDLRVNVFKEKRANVQAELTQSAIESVATPYSPWGLRLKGKPALTALPAFQRGAFEVQDEGSQLLALLLGARRDEMVADFCAGAGGKTLAIGACMRGTGRLYAFDTSAHRLEALRERLARSGLGNVHPVAIAHERDERVQRLWAKLDRVLVDAPCSGLGTLRRNPDLKWRQSAEAVAQFAQHQREILQGAARLVKPGGRLVYATCSLLAEENEAVAEAFSAAHADFAPQDALPLLAGLGVDGAAGLCSGPARGGEYLRLWPHRHATDGFFAAVWLRKK